MHARTAAVYRFIGPLHFAENVCVIEVAFAGSVRPYAYLCLFLAYDGCVTRALQQLPRSCGHRLDAGHAEPVR